MDAFLGEIRVIAFNYAPEGWLLCQGQTLPLNQYQALFAIIGTTYGGDGMTTFKLPDLRGRAAVQCGQTQQGGYYEWGQVGGGTNTAVSTTASFTINNINQLPAHTHTAAFTPSGGGASDQPTITVKVSNDPPTSPTPLANGYMAGLKASGLAAPPNAYVATATNGTTSLNTNAAVASGGSGGITGGTVAIGSTGGTTPAPITVPININVPPIMSPFVAMNYIICVNGIFPPRP
jgi:microcystin-dependent protein